MAERNNRNKNRNNNKQPERLFRFRNINIGMVMFAIILIYLLIILVSYFKTKHIVRYEVKEGSLATNNVYQGIILRDENVQLTPAAGHINYYAREGERVSKNALVYIIDETGRLSADIESLNMGENALSNAELSEFRGEIINYVHNFDSMNYEGVYDCKYALKNAVLKLANLSMLQGLKDMDGMNGNSINYAYSTLSGIVSYWIDGYEDLKPENINESCFDTKTDYEKKQLFGNSLLATGDPAYKITTSENWSIVIPVEPERAETLARESYIKVRFLKNRYESWGKTNLLRNADGNTYLQLSFNNSMIAFTSDRYLDVELLVEDEVGLKIPVTSITQKEFFIIPDEYVEKGGNNGGYSVQRQSYMENGEISSQRVEVDIINHDTDENVYYVDDTSISLGNVLYKLDSQETFTVSKRATLTGVYNMNRGFANFTWISILYQNDEYAIVKSNTKYGLNVFDYIVLNADAIVDKQFIK